MASALDRIIDGASDPSVTTSDLLRRALVTAHRLRTSELQDWAQRELSGYDAAAELPVYRRARPAGVEAQWSGAFNYCATTVLQPTDMPEDAFAPFFQTAFRESVAQLELLHGTDEELGRPWTTDALVRWNELIDAGQAASMGDAYLFSARTMMPSHAIAGVIDSIRTQVMCLALELQAADGDAGEAGGPTVEDDSGVERAVTTFITNVFGGAPTIAQGSAVTQAVTVNAGDIVSLSRAAGSIGLVADDVSEYVAAVLDARNDPDKGKLRVFVEKVRSGALALGNGVIGNVAATKLLEWGTAFLGG